MFANLVPVFTSLGSLFAVIVIGALLKAFGILPAEAAPLIARVVMTLTLPSLVFTAVYNANPGAHDPAQRAAAPAAAALLTVPLLAYVGIAACGGLAWLAGRMLHLDRPQIGTFILASMFGSTAFLGYPVVQALVKTKQIEVTANLTYPLYSEVGTLVTLVTVGLVVASIYGEGAALTWRNILAVPRAAPFIALMIGLLFYNEHLPVVLTDLTGLMGQTTSFLMMLYLGMSIAGSEILVYLRPILASQFIKLLFAPLITLLLAVALGLLSSPEALKVSVIGASTPSILLCIAYAAQYKLDVRLANSLVFSSFVLSLITMVVWIGVVLLIH